MISFGRIKRPIVFDLGRDSAIESLCLIKLRNIGLRDLRLFGVDRENSRTILRPDVWSLAIEFGRIVGCREIDLQEAGVADLARIVGDLHGFRMSCPSGANLFVMR